MAPWARHTRSTHGRPPVNPRVQPPKTKNQSASSAAAVAGKSRLGGGLTSAKEVHLSVERSRRYRSVDAAVVTSSAASPASPAAQRRALCVALMPLRRRGGHRDLPRTCRLTAKSSRRGREARMQPHGHGGARGCRRRCDSPAWITRALVRRVAVSQRSGGPHLRSARRRQRPRRGQPPTPETPCRRRRRRRRRPVGPPIEKKKPAQACRPEREAGICRSTSCIPRNRQYLVILA